MRIKAANNEDILIFDTNTNEWVNFTQKLDNIDKGARQKYPTYNILEKSVNNCLEFVKNYEYCKKDITTIMAIKSKKIPLQESKSILPFKPKTLRDCSLWEKHMIQASRGFFYTFYDIIWYALVFIWEWTTFTNFPFFKPSNNWYMWPIYYMGNPLNVYTNDDEIPWPCYTSYLDYEFEIAVIVTKKIHNATPEEARKAIGGFVLFNDFSARDTQLLETRGIFGFTKSKNFANSLGHVIVTADEIFEIGVENLVGEVLINKKTVGKGNTKNMNFSVPEMVAYVSQGEILYPGEVIGCGTLSNCSGIETNHWIQENDVVELQMEPFGSLVNTIGKKSTEPETKWQTEETKKKFSIFSLYNIVFYGLVGIFIILYLQFLFLPVRINPGTNEELEYAIPLWNQTAPVYHIVESEKFVFDDAHGPETLAFDENGHIFTGLSDGTIRRIDWEKKISEIVTRAAQNITLPETWSLENEALFGRTLGIYHVNRTLYFADAYYGVYSFDGNITTRVIRPTDVMVQMKFVNSLVVAKDGNIYFTDSSERHERRRFADAIMEQDSTGRLFKYNAEKKSLSVLVGNLVFANGVALNQDETAVYVAESARFRIRKIYIDGPKIGQEEVFAENLGCIPDNLSSFEGNVWVGCYSKRSKIMDFLQNWPRITMLVWKLNFFFNDALIPFFTDKAGIVMSIDQSSGKVNKILLDETGKVFSHATHVMQRSDGLYLGSLKSNYIAKIKY